MSSEESVSTCVETDIHEEAKETDRVLAFASHSSLHYPHALLQLPGFTVNFQERTGRKVGTAAKKEEVQEGTHTHTRSSCDTRGRTCAVTAAVSSFKE